LRVVFVVSVLSWPGSLSSEMRAICRPAAIGELDDKLIILYAQ
jgi:hypothetical protein